jgi:hypothetical protein
VEALAIENAEPAGVQEMASPRADEMIIERDRSGIEWLVIGVLLGGASGGGAALFWKPVEED